MKNKWIIVGLRAIHPVVGLGFGESNLPGYLGRATEQHRKGFQLPGSPEWFAWYTDPWNSIQFDQDEMSDRDFLLHQLINNDPGWFRPITLVQIYI